jgi:uncharacterized membrane protein YfcA
MSWLPYIGIGLVAGVFAGMFGIGGGLIIVPALVYLFHADIRSATGTSLAALIPPVGLLGAFEYWHAGLINLRWALLLACGLFVGAYFGAKIVIGLEPILIKRIYGAFLLLISVRMLFFER